MSLDAPQRYLVAALVAAAGLAQLFRSSTEVFIGAAFLAGAVALAATTLRNKPYEIAIANGLIAAAMISRAVSAPFVAQNFSGEVIVVCAWGGYSLLFGRSAWRGLRGA